MIIQHEKLDDQAADVEIWPLGPFVSARQLDEWRHDGDNVRLNLSSVEARRKWLQDKAEQKGFFYYHQYIKRLGLKLGGKILEIGAGTFWLSSYLSRFNQVESIVGVELSLERILAFRDLSLELFQGCRSKITYAVGDMHRINRPDASFDLAVCDATLHHADNLVAVLREANRVLKPGGWVVAFREPTITHLRLHPPVFNDGYPEDGSAMYYYLDGWRSAFINGRFQNFRSCAFYEYYLLRGVQIPWVVQPIVRALVLIFSKVEYPKICMAAQKPL